MNPRGARALAWACLLITLWILITALTGCGPVASPAGGSGVVVGRYTTTTCVGSPPVCSRHWRLKVRTAAGKTQPVRVTRGESGRCPVHAEYPACLKGGEGR